MADDEKRSPRFERIKGAGRSIRESISNAVRRTFDVFRSRLTPSSGDRQLGSPDGTTIETRPGAFTTFWSIFDRNDGVKTTSEDDLPPTSGTESTTAGSSGSRKINRQATEDDIDEILPDDEANNGQNKEKK